MSAHYSKFGLNTYSNTPYFRSQLPAGYPINISLQKCRAFRWLPPHIKELAALAKRYAMRVNPQFPAGMQYIEEWYDEDGNELDPGTGKRLTDKEINEQWGGGENEASTVKDIPIPDGGFADPETWGPRKEKESDDPYRPSKEVLLRDIAERGRERTAAEYGMSVDELPEETSNGLNAEESQALVQAMIGAAVKGDRKAGNRLVGLAQTPEKVRSIMNTASKKKKG